MDLPQVLARLRDRGVEGELAVPAGDGLAVLVVEKPVPVRLVEVRVARAERRGPEAGTETELADLAREPLHALGELLGVRFEVHVVELRDGQLARVLLPALDGPEFKAERLEVLRAKARLGEVFLRARLVEVGVPAHPARRRPGAARAVEGPVVRHPAVLVVVALHVEGERGLGGLGDASGHLEGVRAAPTRDEAEVGRADLQGLVRRGAEERVVQERVGVAARELQHALAGQRERRGREGVLAVLDLARVGEFAPVGERRAVVDEERDLRAVRLEGEIPLGVVVPVHEREAVRHAVACVHDLPFALGLRLRVRRPVGAHEHQLAHDLRAARRVRQLEGLPFGREGHLPFARLERRVGPGGQRREGQRNNLQHRLHRVFSLGKNLSSRRRGAESAAAPPGSSSRRSRAARRSRCCRACGRRRA